MAGLFHLLFGTDYSLCDDITVLRVCELAEGFPSLRRDNAPRVDMKPLSLRHFSVKSTALRNASDTLELKESHASSSSRIALLG